MRRTNTTGPGGRLPPPPVAAAASSGRPSSSTQPEEDLWDSEDYSEDSDDDEAREVKRVAANYTDGPGPTDTKIDDYDKEEDERDAVVINHWNDWAQIIEKDCDFPVVLTDGLDKAIAAVLVDRQEVRAVLLPEVPRFGRNNFEAQLGKLPVVFVNGDEFEDIKEHFRGNMVNVEFQNKVRTAFAPYRARTSRTAAAPAPSSASLPIRDGPPTPRRRDDERRDDPPRREERREDPPRRREERRDDPPRREERRDEQPRRREERRDEQPRRREDRRDEPPRREERREEPPRRREERRDEPPRRREERRDEPPRRREERRDEPPRRRRLTAAEIEEEERRRRS